MDKQRADITQIQDYLAGKLDAKAMHRLEREAQDDPLLMDSLEGYQQAGKDQRGNLADLNTLLAQRVNEGKKVRRLIPWTTISIAAGVIGFLIVAGLIYRGQQTTLPQQSAQADKPINPPATNIAPAVTNTDTIATKPPLIANISPKPQGRRKPVVTANKEHIITNNDIAVAPAAQYAEPVANADLSETMPLDEKVMGIIVQQKDTSAFPQTVAIKKQTGSQTVLGKAQGVTTTQAPGKRSDLNAYNLGNLAPKIPSGRVLTGLVKSADGKPMPGVNVNVVGNAASTQTDANGKFTLPATKDNETVNVGYMGYESQKLNIVRGDSVKIQLNENNSSLAEVAVAQPATYKNALNARPAIGNAAYQEYLGKNAVLLAGEQTGDVMIKFIVSSKGAISNITVVEGLSDATNKKAVNLVANGPKWVGNTNGKSETVTLTITFTATK